MLQDLDERGNLKKLTVSEFSHLFAKAHSMQQEEKIYLHYEEKVKKTLL